MPSFGGAVRTAGSDPGNQFDGPATFQNDTFDNKVADFGGAIWSGLSVIVAHIVNSTFTNNAAISQGGALFQAEDPQLGGATISVGYSTFSYNGVQLNAQSGGAIYAQGLVILSNTLV